MTIGNKTENKNCYIPSLQAADIYGHSERNQEIQMNKKGMMPYSLELLQLRKQKAFKEVRNRNGNWCSNDVINVKFDYKTRTGDESIPILEKRLEKQKLALIEMDKSHKKYEILVDKIVTKQAYIEKVRAEVKAENAKWNSISRDELRKYLYNNGFTIIDEKGKTQKYVVYKRSAGKSRKGECLFIKEELHDVMKSWARMNIPFKEGAEIDLSSLLSYESLVNSQIISTIPIDPSSILLIDDVDSVFKQKANVIKTADGELKTVLEDKATITNSIWDGQSLIDKSLMESVGLGDKGFLLLRNHFFKSAAFNTNIHEFLKDNCPLNTNFDEWYLMDMLGNSIKASKIRLITTPNSLKILKFSNLLGSKNAIYKHWKEAIEDFGICKYEKETKQGKNEGMPLQQMSYQMLNSLPANKQDIENLSKFEVGYIEQLKNNNDVFVDFLRRTEDSINSNEVYITLYERNSDIARTEFFKKFKAKKIFNYIEHLKKGKIRVVGDYCTLFGNPYEMLLHSIGMFDVENVTSHTLKGNQIYTTLFDFNQKLVGFRSPHSSSSNVLLAKNTYDKNIEKYFNLTNNILAVNNIEFALPDILSGSDFDSDSILVSNNRTLLELAEQCQSYPVCINGVDADSTSYILSNEQMSKVDSALSNNFIGIVVNLGQLGNSIYWDLLSQGRNDEAALVMEKIDIVNIMSGLCIDTAKRQFKISFQSEIDNIKRFLQPFMHKKEDKDESGKITKTTLYKPLFFSNIDQNAEDEVDINKKKVVEYEAYNTPMDYLWDILADIERGDKTKTIPLESLLIPFEDNYPNYTQVEKVKEIGKEYTTKINQRYNSKKSDEKYIEINDIVQEFKLRITKLKIKPASMNALIMQIGNNSRLLKILYLTQGDTFINNFIKKS